MYRIMYPVFVGAASATASQARSASARRVQEPAASSDFRSAWSVLTHLTGLLWRTCPNPTRRVAPTGTGLSRACSLLVRRVVAHSRITDLTEPNQFSRLVAPGELPSRGCRTIASAGYAECCCGPQWFDGPSSCRACYCACSVQWRESWPALSWSMFALGSPWDPRRPEPRPQIARRNWGRQIGNSRSGGREPCRRSHGDQRRPAGPIHLLWARGAQQACLPGGPTGVILFHSCPSAVSISSVPFLLQPHSTLCLDRRLLPRPIPNWPVVLGLLTSCVVRPCFSRHSVIPSSRDVCSPFAALKLPLPAFRIPYATQSCKPFSRSQLAGFGRVSASCVAPNGGVRVRLRLFGAVPELRLHDGSQEPLQRARLREVPALAGGLSAARDQPPRNQTAPVRTGALRGS